MRNTKMIRAIVLLFMILTLLVIVYGLGFFTDFLPIRSAYKALYDELQVFNRAVFNYSFMALIPLALMYFMDNHKTNQYTLKNKLVAFIGGGFALYQSYFVLSQLGNLKMQYLEVDPTSVQLLYPDYQMSVAAFTLGYVLFSLLAVSAVLVITVTLINRADNKTEEAV